MHISDIRRYQRCPRLYMLAKQDQQRNFPFLNINIDIDASIIAKFKLERYFIGQPNDDNQKTKKAFAEYEWLLHPRFEYRGLRGKAYMVRHDGNKCDVFFLMLTLSPSEEAAINIRYTCDIIRKNGYEVRKIVIIHLNGQYVRQDKLEPELLWKLTERFYNNSGNPSKLINEAVRKLNIDLDQVIDELNHFDQDDELVAPFRTNSCTQRLRCPYYDDCFPQEKSLPADSILSLTGSAHKYDMYKEGIQLLSQATDGVIEGNRQQYAQIMADRQNGFFMDRLGLSCWLKDNIIQPLSFLDFEWDLYAIPPYPSMRPMEVLPFEFALVVRDETGQSHYEYIGLKDDRKEFIEQLLAHLPKKGSILAYNAFGAESLRLKELGEAFPEYANQLNQIRARLVDLAAPFSMGMIYDVRMKGFYSLKTIQNLIDNEHDYHTMEVSDGLQAVAHYRQLSQDITPQQRETQIQALKDYCGLDALSLATVYDALTDILNNKRNSF